MVKCVGRAPNPLIMYTLALDTTGYKIHLVLLKNDTVIFERDWRSNMNEDETITKTILHIQDIEPFFAQKMTKVIVNEGPGTLTGTRVGVAMANALSYATHAPIVKLNSHTVWQMRLRDEDKKLTPHLLLRINESELFVDGEIMELKALVKKLAKAKRNSFVCYGELTPTQFSQLNKIRGFLWIIETDLLPFSKIIEQVKDKGTVKMAAPIYAHPPIITESKKQPLVASIKLDGLPDFVQPVAPKTPVKTAEKVAVKTPVTAVPKKAVAQKSAVKKVEKKPTKKAVVKKVVAKKIAPKKSAVKKPAPKSVPKKKSLSVFKAFTNKLKSFAKKSPAKKVIVKKTAPKKSAPKGSKKR